METATPIKKINAENPVIMMATGLRFLHKQNILSKYYKE
jgi:hypothetical protein